MTSRPPPLTDADADLTSFKDMPFEVTRFAKSDLVAFASAEAILAALMLWGSSWHSRPAGSLTNDDRALMRAAGFGRGAEAAWDAVKADALRGWIECSDGRLYHPVVAEKVGVAWKARLKQRFTNYLTAIRMHNSRNAEDQRDKVTFEEWSNMGRPDEVRAMPRRPIQADLDLPDDPVRVTPGAVTRNAESEARPGRATGDGAAGAKLDRDQQDSDNRVTRADVTRNDDDVTRNDDACSGEQGPQGKGREGKGRDLDIDALQRTPAQDRKAEVEPWDVMNVADRLARRAGVPHTQPTHIGRNLDTVRQWQADGIDLATVEAEIDKFRLDKPDQRVSSLLFFDTGIRAVIAGREARQRKGGARSKSTISAPPVASLKSKDQDDQRIATVRERLNGNPDHTRELISLSIGDDGGDAILVVTARSPFAATRVDRAKLSAIAADVIGSGVITVRVQ